jgi:hypothetical protein
MVGITKPIPWKTWFFHINYQKDFLGKLPWPLSGLDEIQVFVTFACWVGFFE